MKQLEKIKNNTGYVDVNCLTRNSVKKLQLKNNEWRKKKNKHEWTSVNRYLAVKNDQCYNWGARKILGNGKPKTGEKCGEIRKIKIFFGKN